MSVSVSTPINVLLIIMDWRGSSPGHTAEPSGLSLFVETIRLGLNEDFSFCPGHT